MTARSRAGISRCGSSAKTTLHFWSNYVGINRADAPPGARLRPDDSGTSRVPSEFCRHGFRARDEQEVRRGPSSTGITVTAPEERRHRRRGSGAGGTEGARRTAGPPGSRGKRSSCRRPPLSTRNHPVRPCTTRASLDSRRPSVARFSCSHQIKRHPQAFSLAAAAGSAKYFCFMSAVGPAISLRKYVKPVDTRTR
jgi:hypothetical protein